MSAQNKPCIEHAVHGKNVVITLLDERIRDQERVTQIKDAMIDVVSTHPCKNLIIDMSRVEFVGSIGFLAFLAIRRASGIENAILCNLDENVKELFLLCRLISSDKVFNAPFQVASSVPYALEWCDALAD